MPKAPKQKASAPLPPQAQLADATRASFITDPALYKSSTAATTSTARTNKRTLIGA